MTAIIGTVGVLFALLGSAPPTKPSAYVMCVADVSAFSQQWMLQGDAWLLAVERCRLMDPQGYEEAKAEVEGQLEKFKKQEPELKTKCLAKGWYWEWSGCYRNPWNEPNRGL